MSPDRSPHPPSPPSRPSHSRDSSNSSLPGHQQHRPPVPSNLRQTHIAPSSPEMSFRDSADSTAGGADSVRAVDFEDDGIHPYTHGSSAAANAATDGTGAEGEIDEPSQPPTAQSRLLDFTDNSNGFQYPAQNGCDNDDCNHGRFSIRPRFRALRGYGSFASTVTARGDGAASPPSSVESRDGLGGHAPERLVDDGDRDRVENLLGDAITDGLLGKATRKSTTRWLAKRHGIKRRSLMYITYYVPICQWLPQYRWKYLQGDLIAAITMASFYVPMALSYASNLAHTPPINGLYAFVWNPLIYAFLGTCPQMVVGPEAAGSLLTGSVVTEAIKQGHIHDKDGTKQAQVAGMVTGLAGAIILVAGLCRLGFLDGVLSRPFLRGFISAIGMTILVSQLVPEMGLDSQAEHSQRAQHGTTIEKIMFLADHSHEAHKLTCIVSFTTIAIVLFLRELKRRLQPRMSWVAFIPDRFLVVVLSAVITWKKGWYEQGLDILGDIRSKGTPFQIHFPFEEHNFSHVDDAFSTAFLIALLGFFESCVAAKSLGSGPGGKVKHADRDEGEVEEADGIKGMSVSANRELVALGLANFVGGLFMAIPAFGGYGRSKVNSSTGGKTPMSSVFLSIITVICILFLLPYFYYIPKGVLCAMVTVVAISLLEEAPHDIYFFYTISGWSELFLMAVIFLVTLFWNLRIGIVVGIGLSLLRMLKHSTRPRIQILGRIPGTNDFENAEILAAEAEEGVEMVPHCLIVKIPEPLTFANTGHLKDRLRRLEEYGTNSAHPSLPRVRKPDHNQNIIFDIHGVTALDPAAAQVFLEIVAEYVDRGTQVYFSRVPSRKSEVWRLMKASGIVDLCGGERAFHRSVDAALRATERNSTLIGPGGVEVASDEVDGSGLVKDLRRQSAPAPESSPLTA